MVALDPVFSRIGYGRLERPVALVERGVKGVLFDCRMCGQCVLSSTGMSCPMNCPKKLRNGPCGGVRPGGYCEVKPEMRCVWVLAWDGARAWIRGRDRILVVQPPVDRRLQGSSAWLRAAGKRRPRCARRAMPGGRRSPRLSRARAPWSRRARRWRRSRRPPAARRPARAARTPVTDCPPDLVRAPDLVRPYETPPPGMSSGSQLERVLRKGGSRSRPS